MKKKLLFICSSAIDRSPAAADLFVNSKNFTAIAAGTHLDTTRRITQALLDWADYIFVMSEGTNGHLSFLRKNFILKNKKVYDLHVRDMYFRNDPRLIKLLKKRIGKIIGYDFS
jgi:predicted protein tyrosine phosphatase